MKFIALLLCGLLAAEMGEAANWGKKSKKDKKPVTTQVDSTKQAPQGIPTIEKFIKPTAKKHEGMVNVYEQNDRYYVEVPDNILDKDILVFVSLVQGSAQEARSPRDMLGYAGDALYSKIIRFAKGPKDRLYIQEPIYTTKLPDSTSELYGSVMASSMMPISVGLEVKAKGQNSVVVDFTDIYTSDHAYFSLKGVKEVINIGGYQADKSFPTKISAFPNNVIFRSVRSYAAGKVKETPGQPKPKVNETIWEVASSWYLLPEKPLQSRYTDLRVGYFATGFTDFTRNPAKAETVFTANRWRLEPKPEDMEKFKQGQAVEPIKPIVFYVDRNTPKYLQSHIITGIEAWQPVFEKIGFKNAIVARIEPTPEEDPDFSPEDARYSYVSYKASPIPNAYGPHVADPRSGEVICSHVGLFHNVLDLACSWYFAQCAPNDPAARKFPYDEKLMGKLMEYIVTHEIGHTLGLRHNFAGSWTYKLDDIRNNDFVKANSHGATVMDYMRFNYVAQPEDKIDPEYLIPRLSDYDYFAIAWGYQYLPQYKNADEERDYLRNWVTEQRKANPRVFFGTEIDAWDPRFQAEDLSDNSIKAGELGIKNLKIVTDSLMQWTEGDEDYSLLGNLFGAVRSQYWRYVNHAIKYIGGRYSNAVLRSESDKLYVPVDKADQQVAMSFLKQHLFAEPAWLLRREYVPLSGFDVDGYEQRMLAQAFEKLLRKSEGISMHEALLGDKAYTMQNLTDDLYASVFGNLMQKKSLSSFERSMQTQYVRVVVKLLPQMLNDRMPEMTGLLTAQLERAARDLKRAASSDALTRNHREGLASQINAWIEGDKKMVLK